MAQYSNIIKSLFNRRGAGRGPQEGDIGQVTRPDNALAFPPLRPSAEPLRVNNLRLIAANSLQPRFNFSRRMFTLFIAALVFFSTLSTITRAGFAHTKPFAISPPNMRSRQPQPRRRSLRLFLPEKSDATKPVVVLVHVAWIWTAKRIEFHRRPSERRR